MNSGKAVLLVEPRRFCAGGRRAIAVIDLALEQHGAPIYNHYVVSSLRRPG